MRGECARGKGPSNGEQAPVGTHLDPGANKSTQGPKFEKSERASVEVDAPTVTAAAQGMGTQQGAQTAGLNYSATGVRDVSHALPQLPG